MSDLPSRHCTDPAVHGPHTYADDDEYRDCPGSPLRDRIADALERAIAEPAVSPPTSRGIAAELADAVLAAVEPDIAARDATLARVRAAVLAEIDDMDPDHTMRAALTDQTDQGIPGNTWWRAYCEVGGMMRALNTIDGSTQ